jgi:hypothetical protein
VVCRAGFPPSTRRLRAGTEPRRAQLGLVEATRIADRLFHGLLANERSSATNIIRMRGRPRLITAFRQQASLWPE